jgi:succinoglycan biosynthesis transport protein ExoP
MTVPYNDGTDDQLELRDYLAVIRRRKGVIALVTLLTVAAAVAFSLLQTPVYQATTEVLIQRSASENVLSETQQQNPQAIEQEIQTEIQIIRSRMIEDAVRDELGYVPSVKVAAKGDTQVLAISASDTSATTAARKANGYASVYVTERRQGTSKDLLAAAGELQRELDRMALGVETAEQRVSDLGGQLAAAPADQQAALTAERDQAASELEGLRQSTDARRLALLTQIDRLQLEATLNESRGARIVSEAEAPDSPASPKPVRNATIAVVLGILLGIGAAFLRDHLDDSVRSKDDLELATGGLSTLGLIPAVDAWRDRKVAILESVEHPTGSPAEAYRGVRTSLQFLGIEQDLRIIQFTSANAGEGKTTTSSNVAVALARAGHTVLLVDCDLRRPRLHQFFGLDNSDGFTSILLGEKTRADTITKIADVPRLAVLPSGPPPPAPSELLSTKAAREEIEGLTRFFDYVILDSPPLLPVADSIVLAGYADAVVLVASARSTTKRSIHRAVELLQQVNAPVAGTVLNGVAPQDSYAYGGYGYVYEAKKG